MLNLSADSPVLDFIKRPAGRDLAYGAAGVALALAWVHVVNGVGLSHRIGGDVVFHLYVASTFHSLRDVLTYAGLRTVGLPALLAVVRVIAPHAVVETFSAGLLVLHLAAATAFVLALRKPLAEATGVRLHGLCLLALLAWPPLVAYTTVPLGDALVTDLLMLAIAARVTGRGWAAGLILGAMVLVRPTALVLGVAFLAAEVVSRAPSTAVLGLTLALVWQGTTCTLKYGEPCFESPLEARNATSVSLKMGAVSARHYWSKTLPPPYGANTVPDPFLAATLPPLCRTDVLGDRLACFGTHPLLALAVVGKKALGLCDSFYFQPYAVDQTPRWARLLSRPFGALAAAGLAAAAGWLVVGVRRRALALLLVALPPLALVVAQSPFHVEARYGFPAVPGAVVSLTLALQRKRLAVLGVLAVVAGAFLWQTHVWDLVDPALPKIEAW